MEYLSFDDLFAIIDFMPSSNINAGISATSLTSQLPSLILHMLCSSILMFPEQIRNYSAQSEFTVQ
jgi:hypothetical protein